MFFGRDPALMEEKCIICEATGPQSLLIYINASVKLCSDCDWLSRLMGARLARDAGWEVVRDINGDNTLLKPEWTDRKEDF